MKIIKLNARLNSIDKPSIVQKLVKESTNLYNTRLLFLKNNPGYQTGGFVA
jgi:hypothetical protein